MEDLGDIVAAIQEAQQLRDLEEGRSQDALDELEEEESPWCTHCPEWLAFLVSFCSDCTDVGSLLPSSSYLASEITACIPRWDQDHTYPDGRFILEVGPGTGVFTEKIIRDKMGPHDRLVLVEFKKKFYHILLRKFGDDNRITIHHCSILTFQSNLQVPNHSYHYIISGLPFNNFSSQDVANILFLYKNLLIAGGSLAYFEYLILPIIKKFGLEIAACFFDSARRKYEDYCLTLDHLQVFRNYFSYVDNSATVYRNFPWARVITCYQRNGLE